ncbi:MAG: hypothetical protein AAF602_06465 [Myxococcota bacterium]
MSPHWSTWICLGLLLGACAKQPPELALRDARITDDHRRLLVDAQDEVAIAQARVEDALRKRQERRDHQREMLARVRAAGGSPGPWQELGRARETLSDRELREARARFDYAEARFRLVRAEIATQADLAVIKIDPIRVEVERDRAKLAELVRDTERALVEVENLADETWKIWTRFLATSEGTGGFWRDVRSSRDD